jgi:hypothetical protein
MSKDRGGRIKPHFPGSTSLALRRKLRVQRQLAAKRYATDPSRIDPLRKSAHSSYALSLFHFPLLDLPS